MSRSSRVSSWAVVVGLSSLLLALACEPRTESQQDLQPAAASSANGDLAALMEARGSARRT